MKFPGSMVLAAFALLVGPTLTSAMDYPCPSDPGFCYFDVGNDGCFDVGTDDGPLNDALEAGDYPAAAPAPGSIVCPPRVKRLTVRAPLDWDTAVDGDILIYGAKIRAKHESGSFINSGGHILLDGGLSSAGDLFIDAIGDITIDGKLSAPKPKGLSLLEVRSVDGDIVLEERSRVKSVNPWLETINGGSITMGRRVKIQGLSGEFGERGEAFIRASGDVLAQDLFFLADDSEIRGVNVTLEGRTFALIRDRDSAALQIRATGDVEIDQIVARAPDVWIQAVGVTIGVPDGAGVVRASSLRAVDSSFGSVDIDPSGPVHLENVKVKTPKPDGGFFIGGSGTDISVTNCAVKAPIFRLRPTSPSNCDLTGTTWTSTVTEFDDCDTIVGP